MYCIIPLLTITYFVNTVHGIPLDDPSKCPGHLEPFGSKQNIVQIKDVLYQWPLPEGINFNFVHFFYYLLIYLFINYIFMKKKTKKHETHSYFD